MTYKVNLKIHEKGETLEYIFDENQPELMRWQVVADGLIESGVGEREANTVAWWTVGNKWKVPYEGVGCSGEVIKIC